MEEDLVIEVQLKMLTVEVTGQELGEELVTIQKLQLDLGEEEVDTGEARRYLSTTLNGIHLGETFDLHGVRVLRNLLESQCLCGES